MGEARLTLQPGGRTLATDAGGGFRIDGLQAGPTYTLRVAKEGFSDVQTAFTLDPRQSRLDLRIELPPFDRILDPAHGLRVWTSVVDGGLSRPFITYVVEIENREAGSVGELTVHDVLDADVGYQIRQEDIVLLATFEDANVEIGDDGRSFRVDAGPVGPTDGAVEVVRFTIPSPAADIFCNRVSVAADLNGDRVEHENNVCLVTGWL